MQGSRERCGASFLRHRSHSWGLCPRDLITFQRPFLLISHGISTCEFEGETQPGNQIDMLHKRDSILIHIFYFHPTIHPSLHLVFPSLPLFGLGMVICMKSCSSEDYSAQGKTKERTLTSYNDYTIFLKPLPEALNALFSDTFACWLEGVFSPLSSAWGILEKRRKNLKN